MPAAAAGMYAPYRALGLVSDGGGGAAPALHRRGTATFLTAPVAAGRAVHLYDVGLRLRGASPPLPGGARAAALAALDDYTFVAPVCRAAGAGGAVLVLRAMRPAAEWAVPGGAAAVTGLLVVGAFLVAVVREERRVVVWRVPKSRKATTPRRGDVVADVVLPAAFRVTALAHPPTYVNKILLGAEDGRLLLLNLRSQSVVHVFAGFGAPVTVLAPSPVLDVVAVGTGDGRIVLHNIRVDETVCTLRHGPDVSVEHEAPEPADVADQAAAAAAAAAAPPPSVAVSVVSFCTDGSETLVTGDAVGNLAVWSLNDRALVAVARGVHAGGTAVAHFLPGEPLLITAGAADNAVKVHAFDGPTRAARVLRSREGHRLPPTRVRFSGRDARMLVSAGLDREVRIVSAVRDAQNRSFSQAGLARESGRVRKRRRAAAGVEAGAAQQVSEGARRLPVVTGIATSPARRRDKDFANVVTIHAGRREGYTWRVESGAVHRHVLRPPPPPRPLKLAFQRGAPGAAPAPVPAPAEAEAEAPGGGEAVEDSAGDTHRARVVAATAVVLSHCGNFAFLGLSSGEVHSFNVQSGRHQGSYVADDKYRAALTRPTRVLPSWGRAHSTPVTGLAVDSCGDVLISGGGGELRFWNLRTREPIGAGVPLPAGATSLVWSKASDLVAVACEDFGVYVYDAATRKLARRLLGHAGAVTDVAFDSEGRRVVTSSMDGTVKTWDLPSGRAIDTLRCETAPTSVAVAPGGEFIATCHVNSLSVALWVDRSKFGAAPRVGKRRGAAATTPDRCVKLPGSLVNLHGTAGSSGSDTDEEEEEDEEGDDDDDAGGVELVQGDGDEAAVSALASDLITLSGRPTAQWTTLANLDAIKRRNKPIHPPKKPEHVPFFLPTVKALKPKFDVGAALAAGATGAGGEDAADARPGGKGGEDVFGGDGDDIFGNSEFGTLVVARNFSAASKLMSSMGPSGADVELRTLEGPRSRLGAAQYFTGKLAARRDFEIHQAQLDVFLKAHGRELAQDEGGAEVLHALLQAQDESWTALRDAFDSVLTLSSHFSGQV